MCFNYRNWNVALCKRPSCLFIRPSIFFHCFSWIHRHRSADPLCQLCRGESGSQHLTYGQSRSAGSLKRMSQLRLRQDVADLQPTFRPCVQPSRHSQFLSSSSAVRPAFCCRVCCRKDDGSSAWCCQTCLKSPVVLQTPRTLPEVVRFVDNLLRTGTCGGNSHFNRCNKMLIPKDWFTEPFS